MVIGEGQKISLVDLCGGADEAKEKFLKAIGDPVFSVSQYKALQASWEAGFGAYAGMLKDAMRSGAILITYRDKDGEWNLKPD